jgi:hypothetical protein
VASLGSGFRKTTSELHPPTYPGPGTVALSPCRKARRAMATLLSLPHELLLRIFEYAVADVQPLSENSAVPGCLALNKALRGIAIEAAAASVSLVVESDGSAEGPLAGWLTRHEAWQRVHQLDLALRVSQGAKVSSIVAASLPAHPARVKLHLCFQRESRDDHSTYILWDELVPFPDAVCEVKATVDYLDDAFYFDPPACIRAFPNLRTLFVADYFCEAFVVETLSFPSLTRICEDGYDSSLLGEILERCPNLISATLQATPERGPPALAAGLQEIAFSSSEWSTDDSDLRQFESLMRYTSLCKLASRYLFFEDSDHCRRALALIPRSVRHLAFHRTGIADFLGMLGSCVMDLCWLPELETVFVSWSVARSEVDSALGILQEACTRRMIRLRVLPGHDEPGASDLPSWPDSPWL